VNVIFLVNVGCIHVEVLSDESVISLYKKSERTLVTHNIGRTRQERALGVLSHEQICYLYFWLRVKTILSLCQISWLYPSHNYFDP